MLAPVLDLLLERADLQPGQTALDIGCGTGSSTLPAAQAVGRKGFVLGADISPTLLALAEDRLGATPQAQVVKADAQTDALGGPFDVMISRFGVMFFADTPAAFANIAQAMKPGAALVMTAWSDARQNPYFMGPAAAARAVLGDAPKTDRTAPGPFAFEDPARVHRDLTAAGLHDIAVHETPLLLTPQGDLETVAELCLQIGPAASMMQKMEGTPDDRIAIKSGIMDRFTPYLDAGAVRIPALIHLITARV